jgi:hypothetical protein
MSSIARRVVAFSAAFRIMVVSSTGVVAQEKYNTGASDSGIKIGNIDWQRSYWTMVDSWTNRLICTKSLDCGATLQPDSARRWPALQGELVQQRLRLLQIAHVEAFGEPTVDWREKIVSLVPLSLITPEARQASCRPQLPGLCLLRARDS